MSHVTAPVAVTGAATLHEFSGSEPRSLDDLAGFYFTLTPDLMRPDLWSWESAPADLVLNSIDFYKIQQHLLVLYTPYVTNWPITLVVSSV